MCHKQVSTCRAALLLGLLYFISSPLLVQAQTVGDTFIDTSEWVQSSSPIRDNGMVRGHITETIIRGYRGPGYDRYYDGNSYNSAVEFSNASKIQPIVYENSAPSQATSLEPPPRPTPDPLVQAGNSNLYVNGRSSEQPGNQQARSTQLESMRGFASQASFQQPIQQQPIQDRQVGAAGYATSNPRRLIHTGYVPPVSGAPYSAPNNAPQTIAPHYPGSNQNVVNANYAQPAYGTQHRVNTPVNYTSTPVNNTSTLKNCCDPVYYAQTQFVTPNVNNSPGTLRTYPQYGGNPYPNPGYSISQPYVRDTWVPMIPLRSMPYGTYLGQGIIGQPVAYVDGEPVRNFLRYIFP